MNKVKTDFSGMRVADLESQGNAADMGLTGNEHFPGLTSEVEDIHNASADFTEARAKAATVNAHDQAVKEEKKEILANALRVGSELVNLKPNGNTQGISDDFFLFLLNGLVMRITGSRLCTGIGK